jgi:hypothetical protein
MAAPLAPFLNNNNNNNNNHLLERRLHFHAAVYLLLGASFFLRAAIPCLADSHLVAGLVLWAGAVALAVLSFHLRRFPVAAMAAARLAQVALRAFF